MTRNDLLRLLLVAADDLGRVFDYSEISTWPPGALADFEHVGVIRAASGGLTAPCPNCADGHTEPVTVRAGPDGQKRFFIWCPEAMRVDVTAEMCRGWEIDPAGLAKWIATAMNLGSPQAVVPDRFWRLGRTPWQGSSRQIVLTRRLGDDDATQVAAHVGQGGRDIVLVPHHVPDDRLWSGRVPAVVALSRVATIDGQSLILDAVAMAEMVAEADKVSAATNAVAIDATGKKMVRRQVKAEIKSLLTDDALVNSYKKHNSYRKAAAELTADTGQPISKDKVRRAVERRGGISEVIPKDDSASVGRAVASQRRDRGKKIDQYSK